MVTQKTIELLVNVPGNISSTSTPIERAEEFSRLVEDTVSHLSRINEVLGILKQSRAISASIVKVKLVGRTSIETVEFTSENGGRLVTEKYPVAELYKI